MDAKREEMLKRQLEKERLAEEKIAHLKSSASPVINSSTSAWKPGSGSWRERTTATSGAPGRANEEESSEQSSKWGPKSRQSDSSAPAGRSSPAAFSSSRPPSAGGLSWRRPDATATPIPSAGPSSSCDAPKKYVPRRVLEAQKKGAN